MDDGCTCHLIHLALFFFFSDGFSTWEIPTHFSRLIPFVTFNFKVFSSRISHLVFCPVHISIMFLSHDIKYLHTYFIAY